MREEWLKKRKLGIGGSDIGVLMGHSSFKNPYKLFLEKTQNMIQTEDFNMRRGSSLEPTIIKAYLHTTGDRVVPYYEAADYFTKDVSLLNETPTMYQRISNPVLMGSPDGLILSNGAQPQEGLGILEAKAPSSHVYRKIKREGLPDSWNDQGQWYMNLLGLAWITFAIFSAEYWELHIITVKANAEYQQKLTSSAMSFWQDHILTGIAPPAKLEEPEIGLKGNVVKVSSTVWYDLGVEHAAAKEAVAQANAKLNKIKGRYKRLIGDSYCVEGNGFRVFGKPFRVFNY